jgi:hypothetical protein
MSLPVINLTAQFELSTGAGPVFPSVQEDTLLRKPLHEWSNLDSVINATQDNHIAVYGDWSHYVIADRIGSTLEIIPNLFGANRRPTAQRGALLWGRVGVDSVVDNAFRITRQSPVLDKHPGSIAIDTRVGTRPDRRSQLARGYGRKRPGNWSTMPSLNMSAISSTCSCARS